MCVCVWSCREGRKFPVKHWHSYIRVSMLWYWTCSACNVFSVCVLIGSALWLYLFKWNGRENERRVFFCQLSIYDVAAVHCRRFFPPLSFFLLFILSLRLSSYRSELRISLSFLLILPMHRNSCILSVSGKNTDIYSMHFDFKLLFYMRSWSRNNLLRFLLASLIFQFSFDFR